MLYSRRTANVNRCGAVRWLLSVVLTVFASSGAAGATLQAVILAEGTRWATPYYLQDSGLDGPTVMIVGGIHGDESAGAYAAQQIRQWPIRRGKIIVLPRANVPALKAHSRLTPGVEKSERNLNRNFPKPGRSDSTQGMPALPIWQLVQDARPDWLVDLHEGSDFHQINPKSVGSSIIVWPEEKTDQMAALMLEAVNTTIPDKEKHFVRLRLGLGGTLARATAEHLGLRAMILETTIKGQPLSHRSRQHRLLVHRFLTHLEMIDSGVGLHWVTDHDAATGTTRVALYDAAGTGGRGVPRIEALLGGPKGFEVVRIGPEDVVAGILEQFDVIVFPGGSGSRQAAALGETGRNNVQRFVKAGGGYVGICAGAYLALDGFAWGLKILDAKTVSPKWRRGKATVKLDLTEAGRRVFDHPAGRFDVKYNCGPILMPAGSNALPDYIPLAFFRSEVANNGTPPGVMIDTPAIVAGRYGKGRVISISPHPEQTDGLEHVVRAAVRWTASVPSSSKAQPPPALRAY